MQICGLAGNGSLLASYLLKILIELAQLGSKRKQHHLKLPTYVNT